MLSLLLLLGCGPASVTLTVDSVFHGTQDSEPEESDPPVDSVEDIGGVEDLALSISPAGASFRGEIEVQVEAAEGVTLYYTTDGSMPNTRDDTLDGPLTLSRTTELRVLAVRGSDGLEDLAAASFVEVASSAASFSSNLPLIVLSAEDSLPEGDDAYEPIRMLVLEPGADGRTSLVGEAPSFRGGLKVRGSSSAGYPKKSYALELWSEDGDEDRDAPLLDMPEGADWVLYAPLNFDRALMRNALVYALSNRVGRYAVRTRFVEVFGAPDDGAVGEEDYLGVYVLMERIERDGDRVDVARLGEDDLEPPQVTGGYIFKRDRLGDGESGFSAGTAGGTWRFSQNLIYVYPREEEILDAQADYLSEAIDLFGDALAGEGFRHPITGAHYSEYIDVGAWIDHHALNLFTKNPDAFRLSGYFFKDREGPIHAGPVWDFDRTMGCASDSRALDPTWWDPGNITGDTTYIFEHGWYRGLFMDPEFSTAYWARMSELLAGPLHEDEVNALIDEMAAQLSEAAPRNFARWSSYGPRGGSFESEVDLLKTWVEERNTWMRGCIERYPDDPRQCRGD
ncbi:MAG: CotH kinase family protein [Alphaproteobacteria bacterium]|nr:CotH kinase family protein [Alphaproteobacteria bacterium]